MNVSIYASRLWTLAAVIGIALSVSACELLGGEDDDGAGDDGGAAAVGSCTLSGAQAGICVDYPGSAYTQSAIETSCTGAGNTYSTSDCSTTARVGYCTVFGGTSAESIYHYYTSDWDDGTAGTHCATNTGTYTDI